MSKLKCPQRENRNCGLKVNWSSSSFRLVMQIQINRYYTRLIMFPFVCAPHMRIILTLLGQFSFFQVFKFRCCISCQIAKTKFHLLRFLDAKHLYEALMSVFLYVFMPLCLNFLKNASFIQDNQKEWRSQGVKRTQEESRGVNKSQEE